MADRSGDVREFERWVDLRLVVAADAPTFTTLAVSPDYCAAVAANAERLLGRPVAAHFPAPAGGDPETLTATLAAVRASDVRDVVCLRRYALSSTPVRAATERWWRLVVSHDPGTTGPGRLTLLIEDVTEALAVARVAPATGRAGAPERAASVRQDTARLLHRLAQVARDSNDAMILHDLDGEILEWNVGAERAYGYTASEAIGGNVGMLVPGTDAEVAAYLHGVCTSDDGVMHELRRRRRDGEVRCVWLRATKVMDGLERIAVATTERDITNRRASEREARALVKSLRTSEALTSAVMHAAGDALIAVDRDHRIVMFNRSAEVMFGYTQAEAKGMPMDVLVPAPVQGRHHADIAERAAVPRTVTPVPDGVGMRKGGEAFPVEVMMSSLEGDAAGLLVASIRDLTAQRQAAFADGVLARLGAVLAGHDAPGTLAQVAELAVHGISDFAVIFLVEDGQLRRVAAASRDPALAWVSQVMMSVPVNPTMDHPVHAALATGETVTLELGPEDVKRTTSPEHLRAMLTARPRAVIVVPLNVGGQWGGVFGFASSTRLYTAADRALAEEIARRCAAFIETARLVAADRHALEARDRVLGVVAHDLRGPLNTIVLQTKLLETRGMESPAGLRTSLAVVARATTRMNRLIEGLLDMSRVEAGQLPIDCQVVDLALLIAEAVETHQPYADARGLTLTAEVPAPVLAWADPDRVLQILDNLIGNALKYTRAGQVVVGARADGAMVRLSVRDTGPGIPPDVVPRVFDPFWQANPRRGLGVGLGLSIVKGLVDAHAGQVGVESSLGAGSTFWFTLPVPQPGAAGRTILVVEDDLDFRRSLRDVLQAHGYRVAEVDSGVEALARLHSSPLPAVVVLDLAMPVMDGWEFLDRRDADPALRALPVIVLSGRPGVAAPLAARGLECLPKPVSPERLLAVVTAADRASASLAR